MARLVAVSQPYLQLYELLPVDDDDDTGAGATEARRLRGL
jgi:hypothetical protein